jgi:hypothetical protein
MFLGLFRLALRNRFPKPYSDFLGIERSIGSVAGDSEDRINREIEKHLRNYSLSLGSIQFKNQQFNASIETEVYRSHGKICSMMLPSEELRTEISDLIIAVDHVLIDLISPVKTRKIINGACSFIQTKKQSMAKKGLSVRQLYLMTQWPKFRYKNDDFEFRLFPDCSSFYLFILDASSEQLKTSVLSSPMLIRLLKENKTSLLNNIKGAIPLSNIDLIKRENIDNSTMPFSFASFLNRSLNLSIGSQSLDVRQFLKFFFPNIEEVENCASTAQSVNRVRSYANDNWFHKDTNQGGKDEDSTLAIRLKVIMRRTE